MPAYETSTGASEVGANAFRCAPSRLRQEEAMKIQEIAPGSAERLRFLSGFYRTETQPSVFTEAYRKLLAQRYNLLIPEDAQVLEIGCGAGDLLHGIRARGKIGIDLSR
jgi:hypothetical protein